MWVSIYDSLYDCAKLRRLTKRLNCSQNEAVGLLARLWQWGMRNADFHGVVNDIGFKDVVAAIYAGTVGGTISPVDAVKALVDTEWIEITDDDVILHDWADWHKSYSQGAKKSVVRHKSAKSESEETEKDSQSDSTEETKKRNDYPEEFKTFWNEYPRKINKGMAFKKYKARVKDGYAPSELIDAAKNYARECHRLKTEEEFIKHPSTFLSDATPFVDYMQKDVADSVDDEDGANPFGEFI